MIEMMAAFALVQDATATTQDTLPDGVRSMITAAAETGDKDKLDIVLDVAREAYPDDVAAIDALEEQARANRQAITARVEQKRLENLCEASAFEYWDGRGELGGFRSTGNSDTVGLTAAFEVTRTGIDWRHRISGSADYQRSDGVVDQEQFAFAYEPQRSVGERAFAYGFAGIERDRLQAIGWRSTVSGGYGWRVVEDERLKVAIKGGPAYRHTRYIDAPDTSRLSALAALTARWTLSDTVALTQDAEAIVDKQNGSFSSLTGVEARFARKLLGRISYEIDHETDPPVGAVGTDTLTRVTIVYDF